MLQLQINISKINQLTSRLKKTRIHFEKSIVSKIQDLQKKLYIQLLAVSPVDTGYLKSRWRNNGIFKKQTTSGRKWIGKISNDTKYLLFVNYGHRTRNGGYVNGQFFIEKAMKSLQHYEKEILKP